MVYGTRFNHVLAFNDFNARFIRLIYFFLVVYGTRFNHVLVFNDLDARFM